MDEFPETRADRALGTLWEWTWGLMFICVMTVLSMATQRYSGYVPPDVNQANVAAPAVTAAPIPLH
jgi:hypothetical protein